MHRERISFDVFREVIGAHPKQHVVAASHLKLGTCVYRAAFIYSRGTLPALGASHDDDRRFKAPSRKEIDILDAMFAGQAAVEVGRLLGRTVTPREITALFYDRAVPDDLGPVVGGRRMIRPEAVEVIVAALREKDAARQQGKGGEGESRSD